MPDIELSIIVAPAKGPEANSSLLPALAEVARDLVGERFEIAALEQTGVGYGHALRRALSAAQGRFVATLDGDLSHPPEVLRRLWAGRNQADVVIASRYVAGGQARLPLVRRALSRMLNLWFRHGLSLPVHDFSSGYRLYRAEVLRAVATRSMTHAVLPEIVVRAYADGWTLKEVPFVHDARRATPSSWLARFALEFAAAFWSLWKLRWSIHCADYEERAFKSRIWLQRRWNRRRHDICLALADSGRVLDAGCGSSRILVDLRHAVGLDVSAGKLRYMRRYGKPLVRASVAALPFLDGSFDVVLCSQVIEHLLRPDSQRALQELVRVCRDGGRVVVGTPDYGRLAWLLMEKAYRVAAPWGYADQHITRYTFRSLSDRLSALGLVLEDARYVLGCEMILALRKPAYS